MDYLEVIARNVKALRVAKGYTLDELADDAQMSRTHLTNILKARVSTVTMVAELARALDVGLEHLVQPKLEVVSVPPDKAADGIPEHSATRVHVVRDKTSKRRLRPHA